jgi:hypothetical protein
MIRTLVIMTFLAALCSCAGAPRRTGTDFTCTEHGTHRYGSREELCACLKINPAEYDSYEIFTMTAETKSADRVTEILDRTRDDMEDRIVSMVMRKIERALGKNIVKYWRFEQMDIPVTIRGFKKQSGGTHHVIIAAAMTKYSLSPRGIVMYLPLEYKMHLLEKKKED